MIGNLTSAQSNSNLDLPSLFKQSQDSVVQITAIHGAESSDSGNRLGSGFVYDTNRHIVTNHHVVSGNTMLDITFSDGNIYRARLMGSDPFTDIAVLYVPKVPAQKLIPLPLGNSTNIKVGEQVGSNWQSLWFIWVTNRGSHQRTRKTPSFKFQFKFALFHTRYNSNRCAY